MKINDSNPYAVVLLSIKLDKDSSKRGHNREDE